MIILVRPYCRKTTAIAVLAIGSLAVAFQNDALAAPASRFALKQVDASNVRIGGEIGRRIDTTVRNNILKIDNDTVFLKSFRKKDRGGFSYVGIGKHLDAVVRLAHHTRDPKLIELKKKLVRELIKTQEDGGYIGIFRGGRLGIWWDLHEISYVIYGLVQDYRYFGNQKALDAATRAGEFMIKHRPSRPVVFHVSTIGFERAFIALYEATGEKKYLAHANHKDSLSQFNPKIGGHTYDFISMCMAQQDLFRLNVSGELQQTSKRVVDFLVNGDGMLIYGSCSRHEGWHSNQLGTEKAGETCVTTYLIRMLDSLLRVEGDSVYGDMMERAIYNALFAAQSPDGRELRKYTPFTGERHFYQGEKSSDFQRDAYCCPNNYRRGIADLPQLIYYTTDGGIAVNLYTESSADLSVSGTKVSIRQETDYPSSGKVILHVEPKRAVEFALKLRIPSWCQAAKISVNGKLIAKDVPGRQFYTITRRWEPKDRVELDLPMAVRLVRGRKAQQGKVAVMRGPVLFCLNPMRQAEKYPYFGGQRGKRGEELAKLKQKLSGVITAIGALDGNPINLADVVGGGSGFGTGTLGHGIDPRDGKRTLGNSATRLKCKINTLIEVDSPWIHSIVIPDGGPKGNTSIPLTTTGLSTTTIPATSRQTWDFVKNGPVNGQFRTKVGGVDYRSAGHSMLSLHANKAITFDLQSIRKSTGYGEMTFRSSACYGGAKEANVDVTVLVDGKIVVARTPMRPEPLPISVNLKTNQRFLTLMVTDQNKDISNDQVFFGDPLLVPKRSAPVADAPGTAKQRRVLLAKKLDIEKKIATYPSISDVLKEVRLDLKSMKEPVADRTVRPQGLALEVRAWGLGSDRSAPANLDLVLTEFVDPGGEQTYFSTDLAKDAVQDELVYWDRK